MFTTEFRDQVRHRVLELARADSRVTGGALTGSTSAIASNEPHPEHAKDTGCPIQL